MYLKLKDIRHLPELGTGWNETELKSVELAEVATGKKGPYMLRYVAGVMTDRKEKRIYIICSDSRTLDGKLSSPVQQDVSNCFDYRTLKRF